MRRRAFLASFALSSCRSYADFTLPVLPGPPVSGRYTWEPVPQPVLARAQPGQWDSSDVLNPSVIEWQQQLVNLYSGFDGHTWHTGIALSRDGTSWTRSGRALSPQDWEGDYIAANGSALVRDGEVLYWYQAGKPPRIALARSRDLQSWNREPAAVLDLGPRGSWDERGVADPYVIPIDGWFYLFYLGQDRARRQRLGLARSRDGLRWTRRRGPILDLGDFGDFDENGLGEPAVWRARGSYWMLYTGRARNEVRRMGLARSQDGVNWTRQRALVIAGDQPWNSHVVCDATVIAAENTVRVWFGGGDRASPDERLNGQIGYGVLRWAPAAP